jgi:hypothetical protein
LFVCGESAHCHGRYFCTLIARPSETCNSLRA